MTSYNNPTYYVIPISKGGIDPCAGIHAHVGDAADAAAIADVADIVGVGGVVGNLSTNG